ncbi:hypothetical protein [Hirschia baltica]|uniref:Uncharacterized protein n=1 Tax=Hirschia baltica (strain ATCC 49814 / DSM 5838 / IFAM 1418) TaxID=582402 RepID=C6XJX9_HIRBI|nr:hypothetical protein [Hirschia baltica]ACT59424.1 hypothetical protein Hbal_1736 [Hirschia baltica ATCC 49814]
MNNQDQKSQIKALLVPALLETLCIGAGVAAWLSTDKIIWLAIGVVAGTGFSIPAIITYVRANKGQK